MPLLRRVMADRIAKVMARAGLCSRREAERWIADGRVQVNGETLSSPAITVSDDDEVLVDNAPLTAHSSRLWVYHKSTGLITTHDDPQGRPTVFDNLPPELPRVISVGRLDLNSEGLLLLTNDGELARELEHPKQALKRKYRVRVHGEVSDVALKNMMAGIGELKAQGVERLPGKPGKNSWLAFTLQQGKNREIRRLCEAVGLQVNRLIRTDYGPFSLGKLPPGEVKEITHWREKL